MTTYTKLRDGQWGLRGPRLKVGQTVTVTKRDGTTEQKTVGHVVWTGPDGTALATIATESTARSAGYRHRDRGSRTGCECSAACCQPRCRCEQRCNCRGGNVYDC